MIVRLQGKDLHLTTDLYDRVLREVEPSIQILQRAACRSLMMDVRFESVDRGTTGHPEEPPYRVVISVTTTDGQVSASGTSEGLNDAVTDAAEHLRREVNQFCCSRAYPPENHRTSSANGFERHRDHTEPFPASVDGPFSGRTSR